jgi:hypothetical protein
VIEGHRLRARGFQNPPGRRREEDGLLHGSGSGGREPAESPLEGRDVDSLVLQDLQTDALFDGQEANGSTDEFTSEELIGLLRPGRERLKWITLSACWSAAATVEETKRWLGLEPLREEPGSEAAEESEGETQRQLAAVARTLVRKLDCAVLAMRYPVGDHFAIDLSAELYGGVFEKKQSLPRGLQLALTEAVEGTDAPSLSVAHASSS